MSKIILASNNCQKKWQLKKKYVCYMAEKIIFYDFKRNFKFAGEVSLIIQNTIFLLPPNPKFSADFTRCRRTRNGGNILDLGNQNYKINFDDTRNNKIKFIYFVLYY